MDKNTDESLDNLTEDNAEQRDDDQAQTVADDARSRGTGDPSEDSDKGGRANPAGVIPQDTPDLVDTMNQMISSGRIDNGAYAGEPMDDDEETRLGMTETEDDDLDQLTVSRGDGIDT